MDTQKLWEAVEEKKAELKAIWEERENVETQKEDFRTTYEQDCSEDNFEKYFGYNKQIKELSDQYGEVYKEWSDLLAEIEKIEDEEEDPFEKMMEELN